jgi:hypothetical protein
VAFMCASYFARSGDLESPLYKQQSDRKSRFARLPFR